MVTLNKIASARVRENLFLQPDDTVRQDLNFSSSTVWRGWEIQMSNNPYFYEGKVTSGAGNMEFRVTP
jgi:hypothetical protein